MKDISGTLDLNEVCRSGNTVNTEAVLILLLFLTEYFYF